MHCLYAWPTMQFPQTSVEPMISFKSLPKYCLLNDACSETLFKIAPLPDSLKLLIPLVPFSFCLFFPKNSSWCHISMYRLIICHLSPLQTTKSRICINFLHSLAHRRHSINIFGRNAYSVSPTSHPCTHQAQINAVKEMKQTLRVILQSKL